MKSTVYIGPAGWMYRDWEGIVYPSHKDKKFDPLVYLSKYFNTIEINSPFYRPPAVHTAKKWAERIGSSEDFLFTYKLWQNYTHQFEHFPGEHDEFMVKQGLDVLKSKERLGALLIQFPWSFKKSNENYDWLGKILHKFKDYSPVVEIRHESWNEQSFFDFLKDAGASFANIDQPETAHSIGLTAITSKDTSYLRLHGRNSRNWFANDATVASRYDYLYQPEELESVKAAVESLFENSSKTFIIFNNHYRGQAVTNALQMMYLLENEPVSAPTDLVSFYPQLKPVTNTVSDIGQTSLF